MGFLGFIKSLKDQGDGFLRVVQFLGGDEFSVIFDYGFQGFVFSGVCGASFDILPQGFFGGFSDGHGAILYYFDDIYNIANASMNAIAVIGAVGVE